MFFGNGKIQRFFKTIFACQKGDVLGVDGKKIGEHEGAWFYTIGQRHIGIMNHGLGIKGKHETKPFYVVEKNIRKNILTVAEEENNQALYKKKLN